MALNNRKLTHRRSNGKIVTVRNCQYPTGRNSKPKYTKEGVLIQSGRKSMIRHPNRLEDIISGIGAVTKYKENLPRKQKHFKTLVLDISNLL